MKLLRENDVPDFYEKLFFFFSRIKLECQDMCLKHFKNLLFETFPHLQKLESFVNERDLKITISILKTFNFILNVKIIIYYFFWKTPLLVLKVCPIFQLCP